MVSTRAGSLTANEIWFKEWKSIDGKKEDGAVGNFETLFRGLLAPERLLDVVKNFICFSGKGPKADKILAGYHQYFAVKRAIRKTKAAMAGDGRDSARAHMRMLVKRLLKKYKYPPEEAADALQTVMRQCELWVDTTEYEDKAEAALPHRAGKSKAEAALPHRAGKSKAEAALPHRAAGSKAEAALPHRAAMWQGRPRPCRDPYEYAEAATMGDSGKESGDGYDASK